MVAENSCIIKFLVITENFPKGRTGIQNAVQSGSFLELVLNLGHHHGASAAASDDPRGH